MLIIFNFLFCSSASPESPTRRGKKRAASPLTDLQEPEQKKAEPQVFVPLEVLKQVQGAQDLITTVGLVYRELALVKKDYQILSRQHSVCSDSQSLLEAGLVEKHAAEKRRLEVQHQSELAEKESLFKSEKENLQNSLGQNLEKLKVSNSELETEASRLRDQVADLEGKVRMMEDLNSSYLPLLNSHELSRNALKAEVLKLTEKNNQLLALQSQK